MACCPDQLLQSSITREEFEALAADFFDRATAPLKRILERNAVQPGDIDAVELLGGGSRVPRLQAALSEVLGGRGLDRWGPGAGTRVWSE
jgi:hypoxia up-regulated 1